MMNWNEFAEINERFMNMTPTQMVKYYDDNINTDEQQSMAMLNLWAGNYPNKGVGEAGLISRIAERMNVDEDVIEGFIDTFGGLGEAVQELTEGNEHNNTLITVRSIHNALSSSDYDREETYGLLMDAWPSLNHIGKRWMIAFALNETRNGCGKTVVKKIMNKTYGVPNADIKKATSFLSMGECIEQSVSNGAIVCIPEAGNYMNPMLAKNINFTVRGKKYCDYKYDGIRAQIHQNEDGIFIFNRKGDDITSKFENDLIPIIKENTDPVDWIVDGEIFPVDTNGNPADFKNIMSRIHGKTEEVIYRHEVKLVLFDCLMYGGQPVFEDPLDTRLQTLNMHFGEDILAHTVEIETHEEFLDIYNEAIEAGYEGVIVKSPNAIYQFGARSKDWAKYKPPLIDVDCVITDAAEGRGKNAGVYASFKIAIKDENNLVPIGWVGTGFTESDLNFLSQQYNTLGAGNMLIEVKGDILTQNENGEYGLRFPRYVKYRDDKDEPTQLKELLE
jgi:DNA ligase 1